MVIGELDVDCDLKARSERILSELTNVLELLECFERFKVLVVEYKSL